MASVSSISVLTTPSPYTHGGRGFPVLDPNEKPALVLKWKEVCKSVEKVGIMELGREAREAKRPLILASPVAH